MKYRILSVYIFFHLSAFGQKDIPEFFSGDTKFTKKGAFALPSAILENITFSEGLATVKIIDTLQLPHTKKIGFINKKGKLIIPAKYDTLEGQFQTGLYKIKWVIVGIKKYGEEEIKLGVINERGDVLID